MFELIPYARRNAAVYDPFRIFDDMERSFFGSLSTRVSAFRTDVIDTGEAYRLEAELPGYKKEDISIDIENELLTITAKREETVSEERPNYIHRERSIGSFSRTFDVSGVDAEGIRAGYSDGLLTLEMPKKKASQPEKRRLEIN